MTDRTVSRAAGRLTAMAIFLTVVATLSYGTGAHMALRYVSPGAGAWWNLHEFMFLQTASAALGLLLGIRISVRFVDASIRRRSVVISIFAAAIALPLVSDLCGAAARFGWNAEGGSTSDQLIDATNYAVGTGIAKVLVAIVYAVKIVALAMIVGAVLCGLVIAATAFRGPEVSR